MTQEDARPLLPKAAFFMGDLRDGLPMLNLQATFLLSTCDISEKQLAILFLSFGVAQTLSMAPIGYFLDYSKNKIRYVILASLGVSILTVGITVIARDTANLALQIILHALQGAITAVLPPAFNGITLGITGQAGFTHQVSRNRMMSHMGTAVLVGLSCLIAYFTYPQFEALFLAAPLAAMAATWYLFRIPNSKVHRDAARSLIMESPTMTEYCLADDVAAAKLAALSIMDHPSGSPNRRSYQPPDRNSTNNDNDSNNDIISDSRNSSFASSATTANSSSTSLPSFRFNTTKQSDTSAANDQLRALTPSRVLADPHLRIFSATVFFFHVSNGSVLPLVMQSLALRDPQAGILLSGLCILIAQACMAFVARWCGDLSAQIGRKPLVVLGLASLSFRCFLLTGLFRAEDWFVEHFDDQDVMEERGLVFLKACILSTQLLDSLGAGIMGVLQILVTSDIAGGSGRFSLVLGVTTSAMCLGATMSGYLGQTLAADYGYEWSFFVLGVISLIPLVLYLLCMPETLPDFSYSVKLRKERFLAWWKQKVQEGRLKFPFPAGPVSAATGSCMPSGMSSQGHHELV